MTLLEHSADTRDAPVRFAQVAAEALGRLRPAERRVVEHLLVLDLLATGAAATTASAIAHALGVSQATVVNAAQRLGYAGFGDLMRVLIAERATERALEALQPPTIETPDDPILAIGRRVIAEDVVLIEATAARMGDAFRRAVEHLARAPQVLCVGAELSGVTARLAAGTLKKYGVNAMAEEHATEQLSAVEVADSATAVFAISYRGIIQQLVDVAERARARGMPIVALTNSPTAPLARLADAVLLTAGPVLPEESHPNRTGARGAQLALVRALAEAIAWTRAQGTPPRAAGRWPRARS